ncbi:HNH endonuclease signature motif containing protein [Microlunatus speluncae]|uniref:HNH endonuclease signature motif containing protein n=1 Tax=Microlunatus speluncae TaxID=2594267 RepID=UPI0013754FAC|nr:HNH endonuclease signature motif containing protein [Microlunatus speluncae]
MFDRALEGCTAGLDARGILDAAAEAQRAQVLAENKLLVLAAAWADAYPAESIHHDQLDLPGAARGVRPGGDGTPEVNDLAMAEFSVKIGKSLGSGLYFVGDALDLRHRFPLLWGKVVRGELRGWQGAKIARLTRPLLFDQALLVDEEIARFAGVVPWTKLENRTLAAILAVDPDAYEALIGRRRKERGVWLGRVDEDGMRSIHGRIEAVKTNRLYAAVDELAGYLPEEAGTADERRAEALALLGDDLQAAELRARHRQPDLFDEDLAAAVEEIMAETGGPVEESDVHPALRDLPPAVDVESAIFQAAVQRMLERIDLTKLLPTAYLVVHIAAESLEKRHGICRVPGLKPTTMSIVQSWLGHTRVKVRPVIDLNDIPPPVDSYEIPDRHRRYLRLRQPGSSFPWSTATSGFDLDHVQPFLARHRGGLPGQTRIDNLAPDTRPEHRCLTHGGWQRRQPDPGVLLYRSPHGDVYLTNHSGTHDLGNRAFAHAIWTLADPDRTDRTERRDQ